MKKRYEIWIDFWGVWDLVLGGKRSSISDRISNIGGSGVLGESPLLLAGEPSPLQDVLVFSRLTSTFSSLEV